MENEPAPVGLEGEAPPPSTARVVALITAALIIAISLLLAANAVLFGLKVGLVLFPAHWGILLAGTGAGLVRAAPAILLTILFCAAPWARVFPRTAADPLRMRSLRLSLLAAFSAAALWGVECAMPHFLSPEKAADLYWHSQTVPSIQGGYTQAYSNHAVRALSFLTWEAFFVLTMLIPAAWAVMDAGRSTRREGFCRRGTGFLPHVLALLLTLGFANLAVIRAAPVIREGGNVRRLTSPDRKAALDAAARLGPGHKESSRTVLEGLKDPDPEIRIRSAEILAAQRREDLQGLVWRLLLDGDPRVRKAAAAIVAAEGRPLADATLGGIRREVLERKAGNVPLEAEVVDLLAGALKEDNVRRNGEIFDFLAEAPTADPSRDLRPALEGVSRGVRQGDSYTRHRALPALARIGDPSSAPDLASALGWCENTKTREAVKESLFRMGGPAVDPLIAALKDNRACDHAAAVLGRIGDPRAAVPMARAYLEGFSGQGFLAALKAMGPPAEEVLKAAARDHAEAASRRAAVQVLLAIQAPGLPEILARAAGDPDRDVREEAVFGLCRVKDASAVPALAAAMAALKADDRDPRLRVLDALSAFDDPAALKTLVDALTDGDRAVRAKAASGLGKLKAAGAVDLLVRSLGDKDSQVAGAASTALWRIGEPAIEPLIRALGHEDPVVRAGAARTLRRGASQPPAGDDPESWRKWLEERPKKP
jgi:HEAT repeat protein